jgi:hypothetical protein
MMKIRAKNPGLAWLLPLALLAGCATEPPAEQPAEPQPREMILETRGLPIDRIYTSMAGPADRVEVDTSELDWITAFEVEVVDEDSGEPLGDEFFCHSQLQLFNSTRLMVTATGSAAIRLPEGFGMRVNDILSFIPEDQRTLSFYGMVLNNHITDIDRIGRVRARIEYWTDDDLVGRAPLTSLYKTGLTMMVEELDPYHPPEGVEMSDDVAAACVLVGSHNGHWVVPPGPQKTRKVYTDFLPVDGVVHYATAHLHNHGVYARLTDKTTGEILWQTDVIYETDRKQIAEIPVYSSPTGFPIYADHEYEIEAFYDNTSEHDTDAMMQIDLYYHPVGDERITYPTAPS